MAELEIEDFDTAKAVFEKLKELPAERRARILTWVAEGLGIPLTGPAGHGPLPPPPAPPGTPPHPTPPGTMTDIKSFVAAKAPKSDVQFAATVAYYYRFEAPAGQRRESIDGKSLQEAARLAGRARLKNPGKTLNNGKILGYLDSSSPGEFSVNSVGENLVAMTLPGGGGETGNSRSRTKRKSKKKTQKKRGRKR